MNHTFRFKAKTTQPIKFLGIIQIDQENVFFYIYATICANIN